jgi:hypothetical protein
VPVSTRREDHTVAFVGLAQADVLAQLLKIGHKESGLVNFEQIEIQITYCLISDSTEICEKCDSSCSSLEVPVDLLVYMNPGYHQNVLPSVFRPITPNIAVLRPVAT